MIDERNYVTKEEIEQARQLDLLSYLQRYRPDELVRVARGVYSLRSHDSLKISNGKWYRWSKGVGGVSALDYLVKVEGILKQRAPERPPRPVPPKIVRIRVQGDFHLSKITWRGLRALYYFYLRKLRAAQKQPQGKASYLLREDLRHLDELDEQSRFLFRHGIDTAEQLTDYRASADAQIKSLYSERKTLHNEQRRHDVPEARMVEIRARIAAISAQAKPLRRSMKLCDAIMERALVLAEKQAQIKQMEKEEKGHEKKQIKNRRRAIE